MSIDTENADFLEAVSFLLTFVKTQNKNLNVDLPDFPFYFEIDYRLTSILANLAYNMNKNIGSYEVDIAIEILEFAWEYK